MGLIEDETQQTRRLTNLKTGQFKMSKLKFIGKYI